MNPLTTREREIVTLLVSGLTTNDDIARRLCVSPNHVNNVVNRICGKTYTRGRIQLIRWALRNGWALPEVFEFARK